MPEFVGRLMSILLAFVAVVAGCGGGPSDTALIADQWNGTFGPGSHVESCVRVPPHRDDMTVYHCEVSGSSDDARKYLRMRSASKPHEPLRICFAVTGYRPAPNFPDDVLAPLTYFGSDKAFPCGEFKRDKGWRFPKRQ